MKNKEITLNDIAGYATERTTWQMMLSLSNHCELETFDSITPQDVIIVDEDFRFIRHKTSDVGDYKAFAAPETFNKNSKSSDASDVWTIGALAFYAITGINVFEGKGGETQTKETEIPRLSSTHSSKELSTLIRSCLCYSPEDRPTKEEIHKQAQLALSQNVVPHKRLSGQKGKCYVNSLIKFWPEEMIPIIIACVLSILPTGIFAQASRFDKTAIPNEMATLVLRCIDLRSSHNTGQVSKAMDRDLNWTMMDELAIDKNGECTTRDAVDVFGLNDIGFSILKRHGGVTNSGGRFRDGRDPRYKYSFIEITVKQGKTVNYNISGREGAQMFAIVPFEKSAGYEASIPHGESFLDNGVCYIRLRRGIKKKDAFKLTLTNKSGKNMAFAIINYNSRNNE